MCLVQAVWCNELILGDLDVDKFETDKWKTRDSTVKSLAHDISASRLCLLGCILHAAMAR